MVVNDKTFGWNRGCDTAANFRSGLAVPDGRNVEAEEKPAKAERENLGGVSNTVIVVKCAL